MSLRTRLILTALAVAIPVLSLGVLGYRQFARRSSDELVSLAVVPQALEACASGKAGFSIPLRASPFGVRPAVLDVKLLDSNGLGRDGTTRVAPELVQGLVTQLPVPDSDDVLRLMALPSGACAWALVRGPAILVRPIPPPPVVLLPVLLSVLAIAVGMYPVVKRARAMTTAVRNWKADRSRHPPSDRQGDELGELSRAIAEAAKALQEQNEALASREKSLREFVENVSHDLATPLTVLQGHLSALAKTSDSPAVRGAMDEAHYLGALLGSLSVTARFEAGVRVNGAFDLSRVVERVHARHFGLATAKGLSLECATPGAPVMVQGDETFAEQAVTNLVGNAVRYLDRGNHVSVVLDVDATHFTLAVCDDGPGLSEEARATVLERGERGSIARQREPAGQGLGLSIVSRVAAVHSWSFALERGTPEGLRAVLKGMRLVEA